jgi:hypothetical protein
MIPFVARILNWPLFHRADDTGGNAWGLTRIEKLCVAL